MPTRLGTRDPDRDVLELPVHCVTASALRVLANTIDRLASFHEQRGGTAPDAPCLTEVVVERGTVIARVRSGERTFKLELVRGAWEFR